MTEDLQTRIWDGRCICGYVASARTSSAANKALIDHEIYAHGLTLPRVEQTIIGRWPPRD